MVSYADLLIAREGARWLRKKPGMKHLADDIVQTIECLRKAPDDPAHTWAARNRIRAIEARWAASQNLLCHETEPLR